MSLRVSSSLSTVPRSVAVAVAAACLVLSACSGSGSSSGATGTTASSSSGSTSTGSSSSGSNGSGSTGGGGITLTISSPMPGESVPFAQVGSDPLAVLITYAVTGFTLSAPGTCGLNTTTCGHVHIEIDGTSCNAPGKPYNNSGNSGNDDALFEYCLINTGMHTVHLDLHDDQHLLIPNTPAAEVTITTVAAITSPAVQIVSPLGGSLVAVGADTAGSVPVAPTVSNFVLAPPGTCAGAPGCGQVRFFVNGSSCNGPQGYNAIDPSGADGGVDPALVAFGLCPPDAGSTYVLTAALFDDNGTAVAGATSGAVSVTALPP